MRFTLLRMLMAAVLATWSPLWCQCVVASASARVAVRSAQAADSSTQPPCATAEAVESDRCCAARNQEACGLLVEEPAAPKPASACCPGPCGGGGLPACSCECCGQVLASLASTTPACDVMQPVPHLLIVLAGVVDATASPSLTIITGRDAPGFHRGAAARSLLALGCLLVV